MNGSHVYNKIHFRIHAGERKMPCFPQNPLLFVIFTKFSHFFHISERKSPLRLRKGRFISRYHLHYIEETLLYISSCSLTGTNPGPPTSPRPLWSVQRSGSKATFRISFPLAPLSLWAAFSVRMTPAYSSFSSPFAHKLLNMIASGGKFVKVINRNLRIAVDFTGLGIDLLIFCFYNAL